MREDNPKSGAQANRPLTIAAPGELCGRRRNSMASSSAAFLRSDGRSANNVGEWRKRDQP